MIKNPEGPAVRVVAVIAGEAEAFFVNIVFLVAIDALFRCVEIFLRLVTALAFGFAVYPDQRKHCQVVIEPDLVRPFRIAMAVAADFAQLAFMNVVFGVTGITVRLERNLCGGLRVAIFALQILMTAAERKIRQIVIELSQLGPINFIVALAAIFTEPPFMNVVFRMTGITVHLKSYIEHRLLMTVFALQIFVAAE